MLKSLTEIKPSMGKLSALFTVLYTLASVCLGYYLCERATERTNKALIEINHGVQRIEQLPMLPVTEGN